MKKIFSLAIALIASVCIANAQTYVLQVNKTDGTTKEYDVPRTTSVKFGDEEWEEWAIGTYTYHILWPSILTWASYIDEVDPEDTRTDLKIYRSTFNPNRYKIEKWGYVTYDPAKSTLEDNFWIFDDGVDFYFYYDEETGEVRVEDEQYSGCFCALIGSYGDTEAIYFEDGTQHAYEYGTNDSDDPIQHVYIEDVKQGYKDGDTFYFSLMYYTKAMDFWWGTQLYGEEDYETLEITSYVDGELVENSLDHAIKVEHSDDSYTQFDVDEVKSVTFSINPWNKIGWGYYAFSGIFWGNTVGSMTLSQLYDSTYWKIDYWLTGYGTNTLYFIYDTETGKVYVPNQDTEYVATASTASGQYVNNLWVCEASYLNWMRTEEDEDSYKYHSYYDADTDTFYFAIGYYLWEDDDHMTFANFGYTGYSRTGEKYETFTLWSHADGSSSLSPAVSIDTISKQGLSNELQTNGEAELFTIKK